MKRAPDQLVTGESGIHLIAGVVDQMGHLWHPTVAPDSGIDGQIELRDPSTHEVRNVRIGVQSKATTATWTRETDRGFSYRPTPADVSYWLSSNQPVLLICSRPTTGEIYWRSIQEWVRDPTARAKGFVRFDKERDRFEASTAQSLFNLRASAGDRVEPPGPSSHPERVLTNLMPIRFKVSGVWVTELPAFTSPRQALSPAWERGLNHSGALRNGCYYSLERFAPALVVAIGGSAPVLRPLRSLQAESPDIVKELLIRAAVDGRSELRWHAQRKLAYFRRRKAHQDVRFAWSRGKPRTVVSARFSNAAGHYFTGYRHDAASLRVRELDATWAMQVTPTYLFTWDGTQVSGHHDSALAGIKRLDRHTAVSSSLRLWEHLLTERPSLERPDGDPTFALDPLLTVGLPLSIDDRSWRQRADDVRDEQDSLFGEMDDRE